MFNFWQVNVKQILSFLNLYKYHAPEQFKVRINLICN